MMNIHTEYRRYVAIVEKLEDELSNPANFGCRHILERQLKIQRQTRDDLAYQIRQEREAYWNKHGYPELADGDTETFDTSALLHAEMRRLHADGGAE